MNINYINEDNLKIKYSEKNIDVIKVIKGSLITEKVKKNVVLENGYIEKVEGEDILKIGVFERHKNTGKFSIGFIEGLGLKGCSIAQTIAHDSHNIITVGDNDKDMALAVNNLIDIGGGIVAVSMGEIIGKISLPVAGLMTYKDIDEVVNDLKNLYNSINKFMINKDMDIFITLSFMALPVIPKLKITTRGLYHFQ